MCLYHPDIRLWDALLELSPVISKSSSQKWSVCLLSFTTADGYYLSSSCQSMMRLLHKIPDIKSRVASRRNNLQNYEFKAKTAKTIHDIFILDDPPRTTTFLGSIKPSSATCLVASLISATSQASD